MSMFNSEQDQINRTEWENPANWSGPRSYGVYFSKRDTRIWVPKKNPAHGWTINLAHDAGVKWLTAFILTPPIIVIIVVVILAALDFI